MWGVQKILLLMAVAMGQLVLAADKKPLTKEESAKVIEAAIRKAAKKLTGELTKAQISELQKALPKCKIGSNPKK